MRRPEDGVSKSILPRLFFVFFRIGGAGNIIRHDADIKLCQKQLTFQV